MSNIGPMSVKGRTPGTKHAAPKRTEQRKAAFVAAYRANGRNGTKAAIAAGFSPKTAAQAASRLLKDVKVKQAIEQADGEVLERLNLTSERVLQNLAHVVTFDLRRLYDDQGRVKHPKDWDDAAAAAVAGIEFGDPDPKTGVAPVSKVRVLDRNTAREQAMRHLGLYEADNDQSAKGAQQFAEALINARHRAASR